MTEQPDRQRIRPTREGQARLLADLEAVRPAHEIDTGALGEYAEVLMSRGQAAADAAFPEIADHLDGGCARCDDDLDDLVALLDEPDPPGAGRHRPPPSADRPGLAENGSPAAEDDADRQWSDPNSRPVTPLPAQRGARRPAPRADSGVYAPGLPDPRAIEAEVARRQRLRRIRDILLIAAAVSVLLIGLSLVGLAYLARQAAEPVRVPLVPQTVPGQSPGQSAPAPGQQNVPSAQPGLQPGGAPAPVPAQSSAGRAAPEGMNCPASHPIKGNRESMIYHLPGGMSYAATRPEVCFALPTDAEADGYRRSQR